MSAVDVLAVTLFEAYSRNCGHNPDEHFDRNAAEQWMAQAIEEVGVPELIEADRALDAANEALNNSADCGPEFRLRLYERYVAAAERRRAALARVQGGQQA